tara:strand:+ start:113 stop:424 length:312 start_codon:yes stop_codon:yes gene_type:complete
MTTLLPKNSFSSLSSNNYENIDINEKIIHERELAIESLCDDTKNLNSIFKDLALLVENQGDSVNLIANNICNSEINTKKATVELEKVDLREKKKGCCCKCILM